MSTSFEIATLAAGCFWCVETIYKELKGVEHVISGYTGGTTENPTYNDLHRLNTGHAEAIQITFDPTIISFQQLLDVFWHTHDPTTKDRQGVDVGKEYRSAIFYHTEKQKQIAQESKKILEDSGVYDSPVVTDIVPFTKFYPAEEYHQNYFAKNGGTPYCLYVIDPKLSKFRERYKKLLK